VNDFEDYLELVGGVRKLHYLKQVEQLKTPMRAPWLKGKNKSRHCEERIPSGA
jgi:hypothetical protein